MMIKSAKQTQGVRFVFKLRYVLAKSWFINKPKIGLKVQPNKSSTSSESWGVVRRCARVMET